MNKDLQHDLYKANLSAFVNAYFFISKIKLKNAELLLKYFNSHPNLPQIIQELMVGYFTHVPYEILLLIYDAAEMLQELDKSYEPAKDSAVATAKKIRRHILAHRGKNWLSTESQQVRDALSKNPIRMFDDCNAAAVELVEEIKKRGFFGNQWDPYPGTPEFRNQTLSQVFDNIPQGTAFAKIHSQDEIDEYFKK